MGSTSPDPEKRGVDSRAAQGFDGADGYDSCRPSYPQDAVAFIKTRCGLTEGSTVVDLGAGTGLMTRLLWPVGRLIAIEPVPTMLAKLHEAVPFAEARTGAAESVPLADSVADAVVVAQAFHWFATDQAVREIARVLKNNGHLILVWNVRDERDALMAEIDELLAPYRLESPGFASTPWRDVFSPPNAPLRLVDSATFPFTEHLSAKQLVDRLLSNAYIRNLAIHDQETVLRRLNSILQIQASTLPDVTMRYNTHVFVAQLRGA